MDEKQTLLLYRSSGDPFSTFISSYRASSRRRPNSNMLMLLFVFHSFPTFHGNTIHSTRCKPGSKSRHVTDGMGPADAPSIGQYQLPQGSEGEFPVTL